MIHISQTLNILAIAEGNSWLPLGLKNLKISYFLGCRILLIIFCRPPSYFCGAAIEPAVREHEIQLNYFTETGTDIGRS